MDEVGVRLPVELECVAGEVEGKGVFGEALHADAEGDGELGGVHEVDSSAAVGELCMCVPVDEVARECEVVGLVAVVKDEGCVGGRGVASGAGEAFEGGYGLEAVEGGCIGHGLRHDNRCGGDALVTEALDGFVEQAGGEGARGERCRQEECVHRGSP